MEPVASNFENSHKEAIQREVDKLLAEKPKNCIEQVTLKEVQMEVIICIKPSQTFQMQLVSRVSHRF